MGGIGIITGFDLSAKSAIDSRLVVPDAAAKNAIFWKYAGLLVYQLDVDSYFYYNGTAWLPVAFGGAPGAAGSVWYNAAGIPLAGLGVDGDYYLNDTNGDVYQKQAGVWVLVSNIKGPAGTSGAGASYGSIITVNGVAVQVIDATNQKLTQFTADGTFQTINPEHTNDRIIVPEVGSYVIYFEADITAIVNKKWVLTIYVNGVATPLISTFDTASNNTPNVSFQHVVTLAAGSIVELYIKQVSGSTANFTLLTAVLGIFSIESKGATGNAGLALIHTEHDIILDEAKMSSVGVGTWTPQAPYSASIIADNRVNLSVPSTLTGNKTGHSISWNGAEWNDNGVWRGPTGNPGTPGTPGASGQSATGGTKIYQQTYNFLTEAMGVMGAILAHSGFFGKVYLGVTFVTPLEASLKVRLEFTTQFKGDNNAVEDLVRFLIQRSSNGGVTWNDILGPYDFRGGNGYRTTAVIVGVDTSVAPNTTYQYRLVGYNASSSDNNWFTNSAGYCITLIPG